MPNFSTKSLMASGSSSSTTKPRIWRRSLYLFCSSTRSGISARQGPHHVAQKFKRITLPRESVSVTGLPSRPLSLNSGAGSGLRTKRIVPCCSCAAKIEGEEQRHSAAARNSTRRRWKLRLMVSSIGEHNRGTTPSGRRKNLSTRSQGAKLEQAGLPEKRHLGTG